MKMSPMARYRLHLNRRCLLAIVMTIYSLSSLSSSGNFAMARSTSSTSDSFIPVVQSQNLQRYDRVRRTSSDQRIAELEALMTLVSGRSTVAHGKLDPFFYGKRKRSPSADGNLIPLQGNSLSRISDDDLLQQPIDADDYDDVIDQLLNSIDTHSPERQFTDDDG